MKSVITGLCRVSIICMLSLGVGCEKETPAVKAIEYNLSGRTKYHQAQVKFHKIRAALHFYEEQMGEFPTNDEGLQVLTNLEGVISEDDISDPWGREFIYRIEVEPEKNLMQKFEIFVYSAGPDGIPDNSDDVYIHD